MTSEQPKSVPAKSSQSLAAKVRRGGAAPWRVLRAAGREARAAGPGKCLAATALVVTVVMLGITYCSLQLANASLDAANQSLQLQEARLEELTRPYLSILEATLREGDDEYLYMDVTFGNHGQTPATSVNLDVKMGGVVGCAGTVFVAPLTSKAVPQSCTVYPGKPMTAEVALRRSLWGEAASWNREFVIRITYCCRGRDYAYMAEARYDGNSDFAFEKETSN